MASEKQKRTDEYMALALAPTPERPHRHIKAWGPTEDDALIALAARLLEEGAPHIGEATVVRMTAENIA